MIFLIPLGFLALIGLLALLAIYLIKPSYQNKVIPSSYIWKESLKYRKKQVPASALRNVLIVICQILIIVLCAFIIATPMLRSGAADTDEKIVIIDASADMRAEDNYVTRFERAVEQARTLAESSVRGGVHVYEPFALVNRNQIPVGFPLFVGGALDKDPAPGQKKLPAAARVLHMADGLFPPKQHMGNEAVGPV